MGKVILICGKICSGKTYYAKQLSKKEKAIIFSCDEIVFDLSLNTIEDSNAYDELMEKIKHYFYKKAIDIIAFENNVILEFGFWSKKERERVSEYFRLQSIPIEWHYVDISDADWNANVKKRNSLVRENKINAYYLDKGLLEKLESQFEKPLKHEVDIWFLNTRV